MRDQFYHVVYKSTGEYHGTEVLDVFISTSAEDLDATANGFRAEGFRLQPKGRYAPDVRVLTNKAGEEISIHQSRVSDVPVAYL